ncbi:MAG TPA: HAMP domain-containing protein, partial [Polyangiaceae bacterium]
MTDNVNNMASNLTDQVRNIALVTTAVANGDLSKKITVDVKGELLELKNTINTMVDQLRSFSAEVTRVAREVGSEGKLGGQAHVPGVAGTWKDLTDNVNNMASNLTTQVRGIAKVVTAVANGDLSKRLIVEAKGEIAELSETINGMTETLKIFGEQVTRVAREVGSEGKLGGQAHVPGVAGTWKDLTDSVNSMASNLTTQVRGIVKVVTAVANGDLSQKFAMQSEGEIAALADTINTMTDTLRVFSDQVTTVAREVGTEGKLGGQAKVPGVAGTWKDLTDNVNQLANNLTTQVRAIAEVATAVTEGDLTRSITVEAQGELLALKERVNQMISNLRETTQKNREQDWLKTNLAKFGSMMQGQKSLESVSRLIMSELTPLVGASHGAFFVMSEADSTLRLVASYAYRERKSVANRFALGDGLVGQCALEKKSILLTSVPSDYIQVSSGLGEAAPRNILVVPILFEGEVRAVVELASFETFGAAHRAFLEQLSESIGVVLNVLAANTRTEELLNQSQSLARELQLQQEELKRSNAELAQQAKSLQQSEEMLKEQQEELQQVNEELEEKAALLAEQKKAVEGKNREVEMARAALEEKADQLAISARYKSEFLANMSHELRTPLNSLLILARLLTENKEGNLSAKQIEYARTIQSSGTDLLNLINEVLDLSKVESGKIDIHRSQVEVGELFEHLEATFKPIAQQKGVAFELDTDPLATSVLSTDSQRLHQVLRNLIGNAIKFTDAGTVRVRYFHPPATDVRYDAPALVAAPERVVAFAVSDTGIGIPADKQNLIFEAFQQADGTTSRKYGGTGLGLSISRELARLLGGEIRVESELGKGSTFTLYLSLDEHTEAPASSPTSVAREGVLGPAVIPDDRDSISARDRVLLIVGSDRSIAGQLLGVARERGFKSIVTFDVPRIVSIARRLRPDAILLDLQPSGASGLGVLERLKHAPDTRRIPVHVLSDTELRQASLRLGAVAHIPKPASREDLTRAFEGLARLLDKKTGRVLIVEDDEVQRRSMVELIAGNEAQSTAVSSAEEALRAIEQEHFDCVVLDLGLPGESGFQLLERLRANPEKASLPVIVYTSRELSRKEETQLKKVTNSIILKDARSPGRLQEEVALFLHRVEAQLPEQKRRVVPEVPGRDAILA